MVMKIEWANWEDLTSGLLKSFSKALIENKSPKLISKVDTEYKILKITKDILLPVRINNTLYPGLSSSQHDPAIAIVDSSGVVIFAESNERSLKNKRA